MTDFLLSTVNLFFEIMSSSEKKLQPSIMQFLFFCLVLFCCFTMNAGCVSLYVLISVFEKSKLIIFVKQKRESKVISLHNKTELRLVEVVL